MQDATEADDQLSGARQQGHHFQGLGQESGVRPLRRVWACVALAGVRVVEQGFDEQLKSRVTVQLEGATGSTQSHTVPPQFPFACVSTRNFSQKT